jgi:hypothetical protein
VRRIGILAGGNCAGPGMNRPARPAARSDSSIEVLSRNGFNPPGD